MSSVADPRSETAPPLEARSAASAVTNTPWVVLMCKFSDVPDEPENAAFFADLFTEAGACKGGMFDYWQEMSGGAVSLAGSEVHGWLPLSLSLTTAQGWTWPGAREDLLRACMQAADAEVDFRNFYGIVACINAAIDSGSAGRVEMPADGTSKAFGLVNLDPLAWFPTFAAHEMGHGFGLPHSFSGDPVVRVYGDGWDIMSAMTFGGRHPQYTDSRFGDSGPGLCAAYRDRLGWIASSQAVDLSSFGGGSTIRLSALEGGPPGTRLVRVWLGFSTQYYTVELRQPTGWDRGIGWAGVLVWLVHDGLSYLRQSVSGSYSMQPGDYYIDASENLAISVPERLRLGPPSFVVPAARS